MKVDVKYTFAFNKDEVKDYSVKIVPTKADEDFSFTVDGESCLLGSLKYYIRILFDLPTEDLPSVADYSKVMEWTAILPSDFESFKDNAVAYFSMLISRENLLSWLSAVGTKAGALAKILAVLLPCVFVVKIAIKRLYAKGNVRHNADTVPLRIFKKISAVTYQSIKRLIRAYIDFLREYNWIWITWVVMWVFHLNLATIVIEFFAYYFFFAVSFRVDTIYITLPFSVISVGSVRFRRVLVFGERSEPTCIKTSTRLIAKVAKSFRV